MRISVLIPCFNAGSYLAPALESALAQSYPPYEIIVADDGSTDGSPDVAERFGPPVRCVRNSHQGLGAARNTTLRHASGELLAFLDADDLWPSDSLERRVKALLPQPALSGIGGLIEEFLSPELSEAERRDCAPQTGPLPGRLLGAMLFRQERFARVGEFATEYYLGADMDWMARAESQGLTFGFVDAVVLRRRIHLSNVGRRLRSQRGDYLRVLKASLDRRRQADTRSSST